MDFGYYPGCALHGSSNDYEQSVRACLDSLGVSLREVQDWICCGATAAHCINRQLSIALPARNLALSEKQGVEQLLAPCPMCSMELLKAEHLLRNDGALRRELSGVIELEYSGKTDVLNLIQVFQKIGFDRLRSAVKRPLESIHAACYYGCLLTRPPETLRFDDSERPRSMEAVLEAVGAKTIAWNYNTECCGAGLTMSNEDTVLDLSHRILTDAQAHGANCVVVACPMCHVNLDMKQEDVERKFSVRHDMVIYYLSDLVGMALGLSDDALGINKHFVYRG
jgi:heterodisulfide reductase subunit B